EQSSGADILAGAAGPGSTATASPAASSDPSTGPGATPSATPPDLVGSTDIRPPDVTGQMQDLLHSARQLVHGVLGKDGGSFRSQLDHIGGSSPLLGGLVPRVH